MRAHQVIFALALPVRSTLEIFGYVTWLLDPRITPWQRAARVMLARLDDLGRAKSVAALGHPSARDFVTRGTEMRKSTIPAHFYPW